MDILLKTHLILFLLPKYKSIFKSEIINCVYKALFSLKEYFGDIFLLIHKFNKETFEVNVHLFQKQN